MAIAVTWLVVRSRVLDRVDAKLGRRRPGMCAFRVSVVYFLVAVILSLLATPLVNAFTRLGESQADRYSLQTVNLPDVLATPLVKTAEYRDPRPGAVQELLFYTHPSVERRVRAAMQWKAARASAAPR